MSLMLSSHHVGAVFTAEGLSSSCYSSNWPYDPLTDCSDKGYVFAEDHEQQKEMLVRKGVSVA